MEKISLNHLKQVVKLKQKKFRNQSEFILIEGFRTIGQIIRHNIELEELYVSEAAASTISGITGNQTYILSENQFRRITSTKNPQQIAALIRKRSHPIREKRFLLYLDNIKEPGNLGTIIRTAEAAGISGVVLSPESCDIYNPKVIRASMGSVLTFPIEYQDHNWLKEQGSVLIAAAVKDADNAFKTPIPSGDIILIIGSEATGIDQKILAFSDLKIMLPLQNGIESLNAAIATGILLYHFKYNST